MRIVTNQGTDRVIDLVRPWLRPGNQLDMITSEFSLFAYNELHEALRDLARFRLILPAEGADLSLMGNSGDRAARNRLISRWLARKAVDWLERGGQVRQASGSVPQGSFVLRDSEGFPHLTVLGAMAFSTRGLGVAPGNPLNLIQATEGADDSSAIAAFFDTQWAELASSGNNSPELIKALRSIAAKRAPGAIYRLILQHLFGERGEELDEERIVKSATGIRNTVVWKKLYKFQRDGVVGAIDKLDRFGGCIIADSVGLGKTFEALAIIKYYELRNDRVLVLCPSACATTGPLQGQRPPQHPGLRPLQLRRPEPHRPVPRRRELGRHRPRPRQLGQLRPRRHRRVAQLPQQEDPQAGPRDPLRPPDAEDHQGRREDPVLMLSATPVNNRLADLRNQIAFVTEGDDTALSRAWHSQHRRHDPAGAEAVQPLARARRRGADARLASWTCSGSTTSSCSTC